MHQRNFLACAAMLLLLLLAVPGSAQENAALIEQLPGAAQTSLYSQGMGFEGVFAAPEDFLHAFRNGTAEEWLARLPLAPEDAAYAATIRNASLRLFDRGDGAYAAVTLGPDSWDPISFFFTRRYQDDPWELIGLCPMGGVTLMEDTQYNVWFSGTQILHGTGVYGERRVLYSPAKRAAVLSFAEKYRDVPTPESSVQIAGFLCMDDPLVAVVHGMEGEGEWAGEAMVVDIYEKEEGGGFTQVERVIDGAVDLPGLINCVSVAEIRAFLGMPQ
jgi:hypothetical protein